ncbi:MAG: MBL fold metallo-hydrolase [Methanosarcinaceae archaeon]|nr:MBL fold metallo-hydrolase [Methanosarcinaceae archaeon]
MPDEPGALHRAAEIVKRYGGNINRIQYDRRIDRNTVFFEGLASNSAFGKIREELIRIGYLQTSLQPAGFLKFYVYLTHRSGALFEFLDHLTLAGANITFLDFDDRGRRPERLGVSLNVENPGLIDTLLNRLKSRYRLEILEYDPRGEKLDDTVFYVRLAERLRAYIGDTEDAFLMRFLQDINHIAQELSKLGKDPVQVFESILKVGETLNLTSGPGFYAEVQRVMVSEKIELFCFQPPCGGNIYLFDTPEETVMIDTGYGIYYPDLVKMFGHYGLKAPGRLRRIYITHADADHCGAAGYFPARAYLNRETLKVAGETNRAYGSTHQECILEEVYTKMINLFSKYFPPTNYELFPELPGSSGKSDVFKKLGRSEKSGESKNSENSENSEVPEKFERVEKRGVFPVIGRFKIGELEFEALAGLGGHMHGEVFYLCPKEGLLFPEDALINFGSLSPERTEYNALAAFLMTSVNVDSELARKERKALFDLISELEGQPGAGKKCLICCGHGSISMLENGKLVPYGSSESYFARG